MLGTLQPQALGFLNRLVTLVSASNFYLDNDLFVVVIVQIWCVSDIGLYLKPPIGHCLPAVIIIQKYFAYCS